jgi:hypothetical protein
MGQSYRIRTELGINKTINIQLDQEFEFLEILSLKLQQEDIYTKSCAEYGVVVGRVTANNGFGLPNARVSIFIPIETVDESNPIISSIYPYKSPNDKNEDGYRYNLLPYEQSYSTHAATGTLPTRLDVLTGSTAIEIYDKYYKFTVKTNDSGDYMIMGVPQGNRTLVMDVDLSDIGEFSLTPQDLIRMGLASEAQVAGNRFRTSTDLTSLPQIINLVKDLEVSPLWGDPELCDIAVNRVDFDLRDEANIDIQPTSTFMGSIYSTADNFRIKKNGRPRDNMGNLCSLTSGPGQIIAIRQTIFQDSIGNPVLESYQLEQSGNIIDGNGVWLTELPMNLDYYITNEFGEKVLSNDPTLGIPTKAKYRFKVKWQQPATLTEQVRRPYYLVPNVKEYGWSSVGSDPNDSTPPNQLKSSYYFGLDWSGYTNGFTGVALNNRLNEVIDCEDTFYEFQYNRVYTVSGLIDEFKNGGRGRFIGIKEIDSQECDSNVNKFPVNEGFRNFDLLYFIFALLFQVIQIIGIPLLIVYHFIAFLWNNFAVPLIILLAAVAFKNAVQEGLLAIAMGIAATGSFGATLVAIAPFVAKAILWTALGVAIIVLGLKIKNYKFGRFKLPMITYPDCQACECDPETTAPGSEDGTNESIPSEGLLTQLSNSLSYSEYIQNVYTSSGFNETDSQQNGIMISQSIAGFGGNARYPLKFKIPQSGVYTMSDSEKFSTFATTLPPGERINIYNTRKKYFDNVNKIKVTFNYPSNGGYTAPQFHYDNTLTVLATQDLAPGTLLTFVNPNRTTDKNYLWTGSTTIGGVTLTGINGIIKNEPFVARTFYANPSSQTAPSLFTDYSIPSGDSQCFLSLTLDIQIPGTITYLDCVGVKYTNTATTIGSFTISDSNGIDISSIGGSATYNSATIIKGQACQRYIYPSDIEYYQVLTAITITTVTSASGTVYSIPNLGTGPSFWAELNSQNCFQMLQEFNDGNGGWKYSGTIQCPYPTSSFTNFAQQKVLILQRGVDPYSPKLPNRYGIGQIMGHSNPDAVIITGMTRMNIPIQKLPDGSTTSVQKHNNQNNIYSSSYFYSPGIPSSPLFPTASTTPGLQFSSYTTSNVGYYGALDSSFSSPGTPKVIATSIATYYAQGNHYFAPKSSSIPYGVITFGVTPIPGINGVRSVSSNQYFSSTANISGLYGSTEDLSGAAYMFRGPLQDYKKSGDFRFFLEDNSPFNLYFSPILLPTLTGTTTQLSITDSSKVIMRTDRLPSSDFLDNNDFAEGSVSLLQQNLGFAVYPIEGDLDSFSSPGFSTGSEQPTAEIGGQIAEGNVLRTLNTCENMVGLNCYSGNGVNFGVENGCQASDSVENGCYVLMTKPLISLGNDLKSFGEWGYRFRFFYGLCRGVLAQTFTNNWVNGSLYTFPIQVDTFFGPDNKPLYPEFAKQLAYFDSDTSNFYYRSSPYLLSGNRFIGSPTGDLIKPVNRRNLLFPTTIINLGIKDDFYQEIIFDPSAKAYIMKSLQPTSYSDTSDLVNLFVISRITGSGFLSNILSGLNGSLNKLFTRSELRIDGDLAQSMSINSEYGVIPFSPEYYSVYGVTTDPVVILGTSDNPTMGVFFSSTTVDLQNKDFLTPGVIDFRPSNEANAITYPYGIKSQYVPFYQWQLNQGSPTSIFGSEKNNWKTNESSNINNSGIFKYRYQSLSRRNTGYPTYFSGPNIALGDIYQRGYIFNVNSSGIFSFSMAGVEVNSFLVGAPNHFYFGLINGETALDKFKTKYSIDE